MEQGKQMAIPNVILRNNDVLISVCVVVPEHAESLDRFIRDAVAVLEMAFTHFELLLIDNGSPVDVHSTVQRLQKRLANIRMIRLSRRNDPEVAIAAALDHCVGDYVVMMDSIYHPVEIIPSLVKRAIEGSDAVIAEPMYGRASLLERTISEPLYRAASKVLRFPLQPDESYYRVFSRRLVNALIRIRSKSRSLSSLNGLIGLQRCTVYFAPSPNAQRPSPGRRVARQMATLASTVVSNSGLPIRFAALLGLLACGANLLYLFYILAVTLVKSQIAEGWLTTSLMHTTMFLVLFVIMTILSEYVARILDETKEQPLYFVESETNSTVAVTAQERLNIV